MSGPHKFLLSGIMAALLCVGATFAAGVEEKIPDFSSNDTGWNAGATDFIALSNGPHPVSFDPAHPYVPNGQGQPTFRIADLSNPILKPWAVEEMRKANQEVLNGKPAFTAKSACWPGGVPAVLLRRFEPVHFIQTPREVWIVWQFDHQVRRVYLNQPHSAHVTSSWYWRIRWPLRRRRTCGGYHRAEHENIRRQLPHAPQRAIARGGAVQGDRWRKDTAGDRDGG